MAVEECVTPDGDFPAYPYLASADFAAGRMTRRSLGGYAPNRFNAHWRSRVWLLGTTGLPVGLHFPVLSFMLWSFEFVSNFDIRASNLKPFKRGLSPISIG